MVFCSECGTKNIKTDKVCKKCGSTLIKPEYFESQIYTELNQLFTPKNKKILNEMSFSVSAYYTILQNIFNQARNNYVDILDDIPQEKYQKMDVLSKVALITMAFAKINSKSRGEALGDYSFNVIRIDDRLDEIHQATTLIHELTHHIFAEIFEQTLMYLLEVKKSDVIEAYVGFVLGSYPPTILMNEYCAHIVEGRFTPHGYQNFGSFQKILNQYFDPKNEEHVRIMNEQRVFGGSLATDILKILDGFISPELRNEILDQYMEEAKFPPSYNQINLETEEELDEPLKVFLINSMLSSAFEPAQKVDLGEWNAIKEKINRNNKS